MAELPDRTSPDDWPEAMLVTAHELHGILKAELTAAAHARTTLQAELQLNASMLARQTDLARDAENHLAASEQARTTLEQRFRREWWLRHGCPIESLYGDDGEMQCNAPDCRIDFKREPFQSLLDKVDARRLANAMKPQPEAEGDRLTLRQALQQLHDATVRHNSRQADNEEGWAESVQALLAALETAKDTLARHANTS